VRTRHVESAALRAIAYRPIATEFKGQVLTADGTPATGFLIVRFRHGGKRAHAVGRHVPGLFAAAAAQGRSIGRLYNKVVKGRCPSVPMEEN